MPYFIKVLFNLPHPLELIWLIWLIALPFQVRYLLRKHDATQQLVKSGELMNYREIFAVGCVGGFILLTFIFAYCTYLTLKMQGLIG